MQRQALFCLFLLFLVIPTLQVCGTSTCGSGGSCADASVCATCGTFAGLQSYFYTFDSLCYVNCPAQSYKDAGQGKCFRCSNTCNGCSGSNIDCITCAANNFRVIGSSQCTSTCGDGFYGDSNTFYCTACPQGCSLCSQPSNVECSACTSVAGTQYYRSSTSCVAICPPGTYGGISGSAPTCISCGGNCATCNGSPTFCLTCITGKKLVKG
jgi:proprotein convertase subtilisin/kexin type 5